LILVFSPNSIFEIFLSAADTTFPSSSFFLSFSTSAFSISSGLGVGLALPNSRCTNAKPNAHASINHTSPHHIDTSFEGAVG